MRNLSGVLLEAMPPAAASPELYEQAKQMAVHDYQRTVFPEATTDAIRQFTDQSLPGHTPREAWDDPSFLPGRSYRKHPTLILAWDREAKLDGCSDSEGLLGYMPVMSDVSGRFHELKRRLPKTNWLWIQGMPVVPQVEDDGRAHDIRRAMLALGTHQLVAGSRRRPTSAYPYTSHYNGDAGNTRRERALENALWAASYRRPLAPNKENGQMFSQPDECVSPLPGLPEFKVWQTRYTSTVGRVHEVLMADHTISPSVEVALQTGRVNVNGQRYIKRLHPN